MSDPQPEAEDNIEAQLKKLDLSLKKLDRWIKAIGIGGAILGLVVSVVTTLTSYNQQQLFQYQAADAKEKQRVNLSMELLPFPVPGSSGVYLKGAFVNSSARQVRIAMIGIRIWKQTRKKGDDVSNHPELLIYSDTMVADCPTHICPQFRASLFQALRGKEDNISLRDTGRPIVLAAGETHKDTFGPYSIPKVDWRQGIWVEGWAYTIEQDEGSCVVVDEPLVRGAFPTICEESRKNEPNCYEKAKCSRAYASAVFYYPTKQ